MTIYRVSRLRKYGMLGSRSYSGLTQSIRMMRQILGGRMYPLTLEGLDKAMRELVR
jgi:uncharacterized protein